MSRIAVRQQLQPGDSQTSSPMRMRLLIYGSALLSCIALGVGTSFSPIVLLIFPVAWVLWRCAASQVAPLVFCLVLAILATPSFVPSYVQVGSLNVYLYEPFLGLAFVQSFGKGGIYRPMAPALRRLIALWVAVLALAVIVGIASGYALSDVLTDARGPVEATFALITISRVDRVVFAVLGRALRIVLWASAAMVATASSTGLKLNGRAEAAQLYATGGGLLGSSGPEATRFLTAATAAAAASLAAALALIFVGKLRGRAAIGWVAPALILCFLSFSRNQFVGILSAIIIAVIFAVANRKLLAATVKASGLVAVSALIAVVIVSAFPSSWLGAQVQAYNSRVVQGLQSSEIRSDTSSQDRFAENSYLSRAIEDTNSLGTGLGFRYKPKTGPADQFAADRGQLYAHNLYLWVWAKAGLLGLIILAALIARSVWNIFRPPGRGVPTHVLAAAFALSAIAAIAFVSPGLLDFPGSLLFGATIAACWPRGSHVEDLDFGNHDG